MRTEEFDRFAESLDAPMLVVTTRDDHERAGCLVGFATQASIDPPRMLVCLSVENRTYQAARHATLIAVHVLRPEQHDLAEHFGGTTGDDADKFESVSWTDGPGGVPLLDDCPSRMVGTVLSTHELGDHVGFLLDPIRVDGVPVEDALDLDEAEDIEPGHPA